MPGPDANGIGSGQEKKEALARTAGKRFRFWGEGSFYSNLFFFIVSGPQEAACKKKRTAATPGSESSHAEASNLYASAEAATEAPAV